MIGFGTIRRHQQWLWIPLITIIIVSFVWYFSPTQDMSSGFSGRRENVALVNGKPATINGKPIPVDQFQSAYKEVVLAHFMRSGGREWPENNEAARNELERNAVIRVFLRQKLAEMDIRPSDKAVATATRDRLGGLPVLNFEREYLVPQGLTLDDFERFMRTEVGIMQLSGAAGAPGKLVNPADAEKYFRKENEQTLAELAVFTASNYIDKVTVTPEDVAKYYTNHMAMYRIPERTVVNYIEFPASNFLSVADQEFAKITNLQARINEMYMRLGTNVFKDTNGVPLGEKETKEKIKEEQRQQIALMEARRRAAEMGDALYNMPDPNRVENLDEVAKSKGLEVKTSPPFDRTGGLEDADLPDEFREEALKLTRERPVEFKPTISEEAVYLIALKQKVPGELPPFEKVKEKVEGDFKSDRAREMARGAGTNFQTVASNTVTQGKTFVEAAKVFGVEVVEVPPFSVSTTTLTNFTEKIPVRALQQITLDMDPGEISPFRPSIDGGYVVSLKARRPVDDEQLKRELPEFISRLRRMRQNEALDQWFRKQVDQAKVFIPSPEPAPAPGAPPPRPS